MSAAAATTTPFIERLRTRIPSVSQFLRRARTDRRNVAYDLLPLLDYRGRQTLGRLVCHFKPRTPDLAPSPLARSLCADLCEEGFTAIQPPIDAQVLGDLTAYFRSLPCHDPYRPHLGRFAWDQVPSDDINIGYYTPDEVIRAPHALALANHPDVLAAVELYLGARPILDNIGAAWGFAGRATAKGVQRFHRDYDCVGNVKLFYYLTDIDEDAGPHVFVRGSHRSSILETGKAQTDADIEAAFGTGKLVTLTAPAGSWFLEDVYGFHKGLLPVSRPRLLLAFQYNLYPTPHSPKAPVMDNPGGFDPYINQVFLR
ncbi:phytanoyl-CoA dioxygenase family protein [Asticcacaulis excentricus]|uniref:Phytanoyl-CoA dioxygenase n=1 Tax=Asticcacaulis excentricus (strain ATCC 15261 / DSM 4724 / KCTC 12464 / NCIMB 9791 / VKM B-1370 / CB 48) TaxID=573065 RepID=E8RLY9_ASTEC|nr:phytanoyl-CoA dioxygenase family protein [Asticcacaulis excentricus]ADU13808.1 Phytanoyl-CoA dioxygenase [Asticcacaulis excentricus CB 48]